MKRIQFMFMSIVAVGFATTAFAQTNAESKDAAPEVKLVDERIAFVKAFYDLNADQINKLRGALDQRMAAHDDYMNKNELTIRRRSTAISMAIPQERSIDSRQAEALRNKYQNEIYEIHEAAPASLTQTVRIAEDMLDQNGRAAGRKKIEKFFAPQLAGRPLDLTRMDRLILDPVSALDVSPTESLTSVNQKQMGRQPKTNPNAGMTPEQKSAERQKKLEAARLAAIRSKELAAKKETSPEGPPPPPTADRRTGKEDLKAPELSKWELEYQTWATDYEFTPQQRATAETIYRQSIDRAKKSSGADNNGKTLDTIFTQMKARIDSVASVEQRERYEAQKKGGGETAKSSESPEKKSS